MTTKLTLGISPCPNDTYIFHALAHSLVGAPGLEFEFVLRDVEELNQRAMNADLHVTKLSVHAAAHAATKYVLLGSGGALGRGCGPVVVSRTPGLMLADLKNAVIATPGKHTTANLLLHLTEQHAGKLVHMRYDKVMDALAAGDVDAGIIIHESRFTYREQGLHLVQDLGQWWEETFELPLPLGIIAARRDLGADTIRAVQAAIRKSLEYANAHPDASREWIRSNAQELTDAVTAEHIATFVNEFSLDIGPEGRRAITLLVSKAAEISGLTELTSALPTDLFIGA